MINQYIDLCVFYNLLIVDDDKPPILTSLGLATLDKKKYPGALASGVRDALLTSGVTLDKLYQAIKHTRVPTPHNLYVKLKPKMPEHLFRKSLRLLTEAGQVIGTGPEELVTYRGTLYLVGTQGQGGALAPSTK